MSDDANPLDPRSAPTTPSFRLVASAVFAPLRAFHVGTPALVLARFSGGAPELHCGAADRAFAVRERGVVTDALRQHRFHVDEPWTSDIDGSVDFHTAVFVADRTTLAVLMIVDRRDETSLIVMGFRREAAL